MKYVLLFVGTKDDQEGWDTRPMSEREVAMSGALSWFETYGRSGKIVGGEQLQGPQTVSTVRSSNGQRIVTDGPFIESKEIIGGFAIVEVKDLDEALEMARAWPSGPVEVWPAVER